MVVDAATAGNYLPTAVVGGEGGARPSVLCCEPGRDSRIKIDGATKSPQNPRMFLSHCDLKSVQQNLIHLCHIKKKKLTSL